MKPTETIELEITKDFTTTVDVYNSFDKESKKIVIFSHGFGVDKTDKGLLTDIVSILLPEYTCVLFEYNKKIKGDLQTTDLVTSIKTFNEVKKFSLDLRSNIELSLITHSFGTVIMSLADLYGFSQFLLITAVSVNPFERIYNLFKSRKGTTINLEGESILSRSDGSKLIVKKEFWQELKKADINKSYTELIDNYDNKITSIIADEDEVIPLSDSEMTPFKNIVIEGNHNFTDRGRLNLLRYISKKLLNPERGVYFKVILLPYKEDKVFVQDRSNYNPPPIGFWGGSIEKGESYEQALIREVKEELNVDIKKEDLTYLGRSTDYIDVSEDNNIPSDDIVVIHEVFTCDMDVLEEYEILEGSNGLFFGKNDKQDGLLPFMKDMLKPFWKYWESRK